MAFHSAWPRRMEQAECGPPPAHVAELWCVLFDFFSEGCWSPWCTPDGGFQGRHVFTRAIGKGGNRSHGPLTPREALIPAEVTVAASINSLIMRARHPQSQLPMHFPTLPPSHTLSCRCFASPCLQRCSGRGPRRRRVAEPPALPGAVSGRHCRPRSLL